MTLPDDNGGAHDVESHRHVERGIYDHQRYREPESAGGKICGNDASQHATYMCWSRGARAQLIV